MNRPTAPINSTSTLIQQALQEDSNRALDWLWYAEQMTSETERRYCFERALYIDPRNQQAAQGIKLLNAQRQQRAQTSAIAVKPIGKLVQGLFHRV